MPAPQTLQHSESAEQESPLALQEAHAPPLQYGEPEQHCGLEAQGRPGDMQETHELLEQRLEQHSPAPEHELPLSLHEAQVLRLQ